ncbi:MAG: amidohydrolase family protein [Kiritimatiellae bacterium]|nr:amidohydrolase family protein [Kiritimatiellia bacterium]
MRIDIHTHTFPAHKAPGVIATLVRNAAARCPVTPHGNGTIADLIRQEAEDGFDRYAICPIAVRAEQYHYMVRFMTALSSGACGPEARERVIPCVSLHPDDTEAEAHLRTLIGLGAKMVKLHPYFQRVRLDHRRMIRLLRIITDAGLPILCHTGGDISYDNEPMASPLQILNAYRRVPGLKMICAHCASWRHPEAVKFLLGRSIYVDLSYQKKGGTEPIMRAFAEQHPQDYVLFGSDWPWGRPAKHAATIASWDIEKPRLEAIMGGNAKRLLGL